MTTVQPTATRQHNQHWNLTTAQPITQHDKITHNTTRQHAKPTEHHDTQN